MNNEERFADLRERAQKFGGDVGIIAYADMVKPGDATINITKFPAADLSAMLDLVEAYVRGREQEGRRRERQKDEAYKLMSLLRSAR